MATVLGALAMLWLVANVVYTLRNRARMRAWEATVERGPDGVRRGCELLARAEGDPALLLVHGFADSPRLWAGMAPELERAGFAYAAPRLPGFQEPVEAQARVGAEDWRRTVETAFRELRRDHDEVWVVAHSLGCALTLNLLREGRIDPDGLVLWAPLIRVSSRRSPVLSSRAWHEIGKVVLWMPGSIESVYPVDARDPAVRDGVYRDVFVAKGVHRALFEVTDTVPATDGGYIDCPLLVFVSEADLVVDTGKAEAVFETAASGRKMIVRTTDAGHVLPLDFGWDARTAQMVAFVRDGNAHDAE